MIGMSDLLFAMEAARANKDFGNMAYAGASLANSRSHKQYLRKHHLGKFRKGK